MWDKISAETGERVMPLITSSIWNNDKMPIVDHSSIGERLHTETVPKSHCTSAYMSLEKCWRLEENCFHSDHDNHQKSLV